MSKFIDLTGQKFNMLVVLKRVEDKISPSGQKYVQWLCKCECGNECIVQSTNLKTGHTTSCGCLQKQRISETHLDNLTGKRFGRLVVLRRTEDMVSPSGSKDVTWECQCDCGNIKSVRASSLKSGRTKSCGCLEEESRRKKRKYSSDLTGQKFGKLTVVSQAESVFDDNGKEIIQWNCKCECGNSKVIKEYRLLYGGTKSCGCLINETNKEIHFKDLTGQRFGRLLVINRADDKVQSNGKHSAMWNCLCNCGNTKIVRSSHLISGKCTSCGCYLKDKIREICFKNLTGQRFGRLTVIKEVEKYISPQGNAFTQWLCVCDCGNETVVTTRNLTSGYTKSCGCLHKDVMTEKFQDDLTGMKFNSLTVIKRTDDYIQPNGRKRSKWLCKCDCGNYTEVYSEALKKGHTRSCGCQKSTGEYSILRYLDKNNIDYEYQKRFNDCCGTGNKPLSYDFYLPNQSLLIEYQGQQHYYPVDIYGGEEKFEIQQEHDRRKREYAKSNGYNLLEIPYYDYDNIEEILNKALSISEVGNS